MLIVNAVRDKEAELLSQHEDKLKVMETNYLNRLEVDRKQIAALYEKQYVIAST